MDKLTLYKGSLAKWDYILEKFRKESDCDFSDFYMTYCMTPCFFCLEFRGCEKCSINKDICDYKNDVTIGLIGEGIYIDNREEFRDWILRMIASLKAEIKLLET